jgi:hypothetical protein
VNLSPVGVIIPFCLIYCLYKTEWYYNTYWGQIHIPPCTTPIVYIKQNGIITLTGERFTYRCVGEGHDGM